MFRESKWFRALLFGSIYFVEGTILTYSSSFSTIYLRQFNLSFTRIGIAGGIALLPFILKIFLGMLSDRVSLFGLGHRRPYMIAGLTAQGAGLLLVPLINPETAFLLYIAVMLFVSLGMSTYDTTADGFAIDVTPASERGFVQGVMVAGRGLGAIVLAWLMGVLVARVSWTALFVLLGAVSFLPMILVLLAREGARGPEREFSLAGFRSFLTIPVGLFLLLGLVYPLVLWSANGMVGAFLNEVLGVDVGQVGFYTSLFGVGAVLGALAGGPIADRLSRRDSLIAALILSSLALLALVLSGSPSIALGVVILFGIAFGYYETVYMAAGMDLTDPRIAATMFAIIMAVGNIGIGLGQPLAGALVDGLGFSGLFLVLALVNLASFPLIPFIFRRRQLAGGMQL